MWQHQIGTSEIVSQQTLWLETVPKEHSEAREVYSEELRLCNFAYTVSLME
jgi:hypothetical protein